MKKLLLWVPAAACALVLAAQVGFYRFVETPVISSDASWVFKPKDLNEAQAKAKTIVQGQVISVTRGADIVTPAKGEPDGEDRIPTQHIQFRVDAVQKGAAKVGQVLDLFQTGGLAAPTGQPDGKQGARVQTHLVLLSGDPLYQVGEQYLLLLDDGPRGMQRPISPEGRYKIESNGTVTPVIDNEVTAPVKGKPVDVLRRAVVAGAAVAP
jgi:hypothetical protein